MRNAPAIELFVANTSILVKFKDWIPRYAQKNIGKVAVVLIPFNIYNLFNIPTSSIGSVVKPYVENNYDLR